MKKKIIIEIECADDGVHCGGIKGDGYVICSKLRNRSCDSDPDAGYGCTEFGLMPGPCVFPTWEKGNCAPCSAACEARAGFFEQGGILKAKPDLSAVKKRMKDVLPNVLADWVDECFADFEKEIG